MADARNKWDIEKLDGNLKMLRQERENLLQNKNFLMNLETEIMTNWKSIAGDIYLEKVEVDQGNLDFILEAIEQQADDLQDVIHNTYQNCEDQIKARLRTLSGRIG